MISNLKWRFHKVVIYVFGLKISNLKWRFQKVGIYVFRFENICNYKLVTTVYSRPADSHFYLQLNSSHNPKTVHGIQKGVA